MKVQIFGQMDYMVMLTMNLLRVICPVLRSNEKKYGCQRLDDLICFLEV